jgi:hypothetical protein
MKRAAQFLIDLSPVIAFYLAVALVVVFGVLKHPEAWITPPAKTAPYLPNGSDTVPHRVSCYVRNDFNYRTDAEGGYCQPERFDV